jgi:hypothetical protein
VPESRPKVSTNTNAPVPDAQAQVPPNTRNPAPELRLERPSTTSAAGPEPQPEVPPNDWEAAVSAIKRESPRLGTSLAVARLVELRQVEVLLAFPPDALFHRKVVVDSSRGQLERLLSAHFGRPIRIRLEDAGFARASPSPAERQAEEEAERQRKLESRVRSHPAVGAVLRALGGEIEAIEPLERRGEYLAEDSSPSPPDTDAAER